MASNEDWVKAALKVSLDGQAYLWAKLRGLEREMYGEQVTEEMLTALQDEWKNETKILIEGILHG